MKATSYRIVFFIIFSYFLIVPLTYAAKGTTYTVGTDHLNIRKAPDPESAVVGQLHTGDHVVVYKESHGWMQTYYNDEAAWVASQYLVDGEQKMPANDYKENSTQITVSAQSVRLRTGPGTNYNVIDHTSLGDTYNVLEQDGEWLKVSLEDHSTAWIASWLTTDGTPQEASKSSITNHNLNGYNIVLDAGHGGTDPGTISVNGDYEKDYTLKITQSVANRLREAGATVLLTRSNDRSVSLEQRVNVSHAYSTDAFISLHYDAYPINSISGVSTHYYTAEDAKLAQNIQASLEQYLPLKSRGLMQSSYYVLRENHHVSSLVELGFMTNLNDLIAIQSERHQHDVANAIADGLINYFNK